jgi:hypothetical protein
MRPAVNGRKTAMRVYKGSTALACCKDLTGTAPIPEVAARLGMNVKVLRGLVFRGLTRADAPIGCPWHDRVYDNAMLARVVAARADGVTP